MKPDQPDHGAGVRDLLDRVRTFVARYVVLPGEAEATALALFVLHTWAIEAASATPYLLVVSPERRTGKSRLLEVLRLLVRSPWHTSSTSEAALFRKIEQDQPTLLLDEIDAIFGARAETTEPLRAVLNSGNRRGATVARCVGKGSEMTVRDFAVFCPKVLAGIDTGRLPDTICDRSIELGMKRRHAGEAVIRLREATAEADAEPLRGAIEAWAAADVPHLKDAEPDLPHGLDDRAADAWEPLFAIADRAGGAWPSAARDAALALRDDEPDEASYGTQALMAVRATMAGREVVATSELLDAINADETLPFGGWRDGKGLDARKLARLLKPYGVKPKTVRIGNETPKGYRADDLADPCARYLPAGNLDPQHGPNRQHETPHGYGDVADVADVADFAGYRRRDSDHGPPAQLATGDEAARIESLLERHGGGAL